MAALAEIEEFMDGPLVTWFRSCLEHPEKLADYEDLVDGVLIHEVLLQIDPEPIHSAVVPCLGNPIVRVRNMDLIIKNIKALYEEEFGQLLLLRPDPVMLGREPESKTSVEDMQLLILLLLGCAVQCPNKETFIENIKQLNIDVQHAIVECIKQVTDNQQIVWTQEWCESVLTSNTDVFSPCELMMNHVKRLVKERDVYMQQLTCVITQDRDTEMEEGEPQGKLVVGGESHHLAVELADWKARLRKQRQELEEKSEALAESKEELEHNKSLVSKLRQEIQDLMQDARSAKAYRDELDAVRERAERVEKLEAEVQRYRDKLSDIEFYKTRIEELREDNRVLMETKDMLEEQLQRARKRSEHILELEGEIIKYKQQINDLVLEREANQEKLQELMEENTQLQLLTKSALSESSTADVDSDAVESISGSCGDNSLSEQLTSNAQARALRLELENRRLLSTIDNLKESSFHENSSKILELEKEKKKLSLKVDQLQENCQRLLQQNIELEESFKEALHTNKKLQDSLQVLKTNSEKQHQELQADRARLEELQSNLETACNEKLRLQCNLQSLQQRIVEMEKTAEGMTQQLEKWQSEAQRVPGLESQVQKYQMKMADFEKENVALQREIAKVKEALEDRDVKLDDFTTKNSKQEKEIVKLKKELDEAISTINRLHDVERESQELASRAAVDRETLTTLQQDLVSEKLLAQQLKSNLERLSAGLLRLGMDAEEVSDNDFTLERWLSSADILEAVQKIVPQFEKKSDAESKKETACQTSLQSEPNLKEMVTATEEKNAQLQKNNEELHQKCEELKLDVEASQSVIKSLQNETTIGKQQNDSLQSNNAKLQVDVATLQSQIASLSSQHTALQLANSQLVVEKEELVKDKNTLQAAHQQLLKDQVTLQSLHEQLAAQYDSLLKERDSLKTLQRDLRSELKIFKEKCDLLAANKEELNKLQTTLEKEKETLRVETRSLGNLRAEHSKLKDDFRNLFAASEKLKGEYRNLQEDYKSLRTENSNLKLKQTEMQGEIANRSDHSTVLEVELSKLSNKCEMLIQMNATLEDDRRSLMEHVSHLLTQYHELLTHSLEDKEHFHSEEKVFTDRLNDLRRQKEKLEEKIMEHYRRMESCSPKKKGFGASLVRKVRKAGSEIISKVPKSGKYWQQGNRSRSQANVSHESESGELGNESDTSLDDVYLQSPAEHQSSDGFTQSTLSLGSAGTRRAVYYTEDGNRIKNQENESYDKRTDDESNLPFNNVLPENSAYSGNQGDMRSFLVYNRISASISGGGDASASQCVKEEEVNCEDSASSCHLDDSNKRTKPKLEQGENSVWYEYGCV